MTVLFVIIFGLISLATILCLIHNYTIRKQRGKQQIARILASSIAFVCGVLVAHKYPSESLLLFVLSCALANLGTFEHLD
jgi:uncharacterized membrane protein HdeD (DUF308 family)